eukprot:gb/GECG01013984.1/.p1 GENE.gb/GECG01013984.1/~~gb/GECG01013984.1/.p1  ORF type:complete len:316 (+),score=39.26 gb/GECG01013984.1/:1-948(+)
MLSPVLQALIATIFTYALTAGGSAVVFCLDTAKHHGTVMSIATGLMLAAVTELLSSCLHESEDLESLAWIPIAVGFLLATVVLWLMDNALNRIGHSPGGEESPADDGEPQQAEEDEEPPQDYYTRVFNGTEAGSSVGQVYNYSPKLRLPPSTGDMSRVTYHESQADGVELTSRANGNAKDGLAVAACATNTTLDTRATEQHTERTTRTFSAEDNDVERNQLLGSQLEVPREFDDSEEAYRKARLLVFALAVQHIPEALACGVAFAAATRAQTTEDQEGETLGAAISLTLAIGLQVSIVARNTDIKCLKIIFFLSA